MKQAFITFIILVIIDAYVIDSDVEQGSYTELPSEYNGIADAIMKDDPPGGDMSGNRYISDENPQDKNYNIGPDELYSQNNDTPYNYYQDVEWQDSDPNMSQNSQDNGFSSDGYEDKYLNNGNAIDYYGRQGGSEDYTNMLYGNEDGSRYDETDGGNQINTGYGDYDEQNQGYNNNKIDGSDSVGGNKNNSPGDDSYENNYNNGNCRAANIPAVRPFEVTMNTGPNNPYPKGQCTEWADGRTYQIKGVHVNFNGDAHLWNDIASDDPRWQVSDQPSVGSMMVLEQGSQGVSDVTGHVAIVESFSGSSVCTSNWNFPTLGQTTYKTLQTGPGVSFVSYVGY